MTAVHTIFVPKGWSPEQVWETIKRGQTVVASGASKKQEGAWVNVDERGRVVA